MKKRRILIAVFASVFACSLLLFAGCSDTNKLKTPNILELNDENVLNWSEIEAARSYTVSIEDSNGAVTENSTRNTYYSLDSLPMGNYYVKVKAIGNKRNNKDSDWSERVDFQKGYSTGLIYKLIDNDTAYAIVDKGRASGDVVIEDYYRNGLPVTMIDESAFRGANSIENIVIGSNVTYIGDDAFYNCTALKMVKFPDDLLYIGKSAFQGCSLITEITIPSGVSSISQYAFSYCRSLEKINFAIEETTSIDGEKFTSGVRSIGQSAFTECRAITELVMPETLEGIAASAFSRLSSLKKVTFNSKLGYINSGAFSYNPSLTEVIFPADSNLTFIGKGAFRNCSSLTEFNVPSKVEEISDEVFVACVLLRAVNIPESVQIIGQNAFLNTALYNEQAEAKANFVFVDDWLVAYNGVADYNFIFNSVALKRSSYYPENGIVGISSYCMKSTGITAIVLPASVKFLSPYAFSGCLSLESFETETSSDLKVIGTGCFYNSGLSKVLLPDGLETIDGSAFNNCRLLQTIGSGSNSDVNAIPSSVTKIGTFAFHDSGLWENAGTSENDGIVCIGKWIVDYNPYVDGYEESKRAITQIDLSQEKYENISNIANYAFYNLTDLTTITHSEKLTRIGTGAFYGCEALSRFTFSNRLKEIPSYAFYGCKSLDMINFKTGFNAELSTIGSYAFYDCEALTLVDLKQTRVSQIGAYAFAFCYNLYDVDFFAESDYENESGEYTLKEIGSYAFYNAKKLTELQIPDSVQTIYPYAFFECDGLKTIDFGAGVKYIFDAAFYGCGKLEEINLPYSLVYLGGKAFYKCYSLFDVNFQTLKEGDETVAGIVYIGNYAFYSDEQITSLVLPETLKYIGKYAFKGIPGLGAVTLGSNIETVGAHAFYGSSALTFYVQAESAPEGWSLRWNSLMRPVVWGVTLDKAGEYVYSLAVKNDTFSCVNDIRSISAPRRAGHTFVGWSLTENGEVAYTESTVRTAPSGTMLYSVWKTAAWEIVRGSDGKIVSVIVGAYADEMPEDVIVEKSSESIGIDEVVLFGWAFERNGEPVFLQSYNLDEKTLARLAPGTKLYAVYYNLAGLAEAVSQLKNKRGEVVDSPNGSMIWSQKVS